MRFAAAIGIALCIAVVSGLAESEPSTVPGHGDAVPLSEAPDEIVIFHPGALPEVRVIDETGAEVPGLLEPRGTGSSAFVPETSPLPAGQYTVHFTGAGELHTFTVGPDVYGPRAVAIDPVDVARDTTVAVSFTEPLDPSTVGADTVWVYQQTKSGKRRDVPGTVSLDPTGTKIVFTPEGWPGFKPESTFRVMIQETVSDATGNAIDRTPLHVESDVETPEERPDLPRVPESVFWSSRKEIGVLDLALRNRGTFDSDDVAKPPPPPAASVLTNGLGDPDELVIDPRVNARGEGYVYGVDPKGQRVVAFETSTGKTYELRAAETQGIAIDPAGERLYATARTNLTSMIMVFGLEGGYPHCIGPEGCLDLPFRSDERIEVGRRKAKPNALAVSPDGSIVACLLQRQREVALCDPTAEEPYALVPTDRKPRDLTFVARPGGDPLLLVACRGKRARNGKVLVLDGRTGDLLGELTGFKKPARITARGQRAWVAEEGGHRVTAIDVPAEGMPTRGPTFAAGKRPVDVAFAPDDTGRLFVVNRGKSRITVLSAETGEILEKIEAKGAIAICAWGEN